MSTKVKPGIIYAVCCQRYFNEYGEAFLRSGKAHGNTVEVFNDGNMDVSDTHKIGYCLTRMKMLPELAAKYGSALLLDVDTIFRGVVEIEADYDAAIYPRLGNAKAIHKALGGAVYCTDRALPFAQAMADKAAAPNLHWGDDQRIIWETWDALPDKSKVKSLDRSFIDWDFPTKAPIFTAKGALKRHPIFTGRVHKWRSAPEGRIVC
jgi:hypothetical protein